ncbi:ubiquinone biosynthesis protein UbiA [Lacihabitans sp. LS3-19]|uniref:UbiA family prenyltransferase n=1 Tax=Lacihabitans sp. LS3-19 TaxID=2487335 RepID=UPI0020CD5A0F|nr:UbiA family prenyltransferase [Lacihabitans sp. LS3-19]MCP9770194.1 ubiquinone biosynthesis protein UbiA [Lacihabitans sp. LS3-19]
MKLKDIFLHLRLPFSLFLMPVFWLAISQQSHGVFEMNLWIFVILHLLIYPSSNAFNSYFDKDEGSIGGLKNPPKVDKQLWHVANIFDALGILLSIVFVNLTFAGFVLLYVLVSRMYSHPSIRIKKMPVLSWLIVGLFQGALVYMMVWVFGQDFDISSFLKTQNSAGSPIWLGALFSALILWAVYPITQVYQHEEDAKNGDKTLSILLGIRGTFVFTMLLFSMAVGSAYLFLPLPHFFAFLFFSAPIAVFMNWWFFKVLKDQANANFKYTMLLNAMASLLLNICFVYNSLHK